MAAHPVDDVTCIASIAMGELGNTVSVVIIGFVTNGDSPDSFV